jgi:hypothetical protein
MVIKIFQSFLNDAVQLYSASVTLDDPTTATATGLFQRFSLGYKDHEPSMILQFMADEDTIIDLSPPAGASSWMLTAALGFKTSLMSLVNTETNRIKTSMDLRYSNKCILAIDAEQMFVTDVSHDNHLGLSYLTVERSGNVSAHYPDAEVRVVRTKPVITMLDVATGKVKISWTSDDTDAPGDYELEATLTRIDGSHTVRWSVVPLLITITKDYDLS